MVKRRDKYELPFTARDKVTGEPQDLTGSSQRLLWKVAPGEITAGDGEALEITGGDLAAGVVSTNKWHDLDDGDWDVELEVTYADGTIVTYPSGLGGKKLYTRVTIEPDLG